jgi:hypothetical protein
VWKKEKNKRRKLKMNDKKKEKIKEEMKKKAIGEFSEKTSKKDTTLINRLESVMKQDMDKKKEKK